MRFSSVVGHKKVLSFFNEKIDKEKIEGFYIFNGPVGVGKKFIVKFISKYLLCDFKKDDTCNCFNCRKFPDYLPYLEIDNGNKSILIEDIVKIDELVSLLPNKKKVVVINNAHNLTVNSSNKLLKLFEDTKGGLTVFLVSHCIDLLIDPLVSRCNLFTFSFLKKEEVYRILDNLGIKEVDRELIDMVPFFTNSLFENYEIYKRYKEEIYNFFGLLLSRRISEVLLELREQEKKEEIDFFIDLLLVFFNDILRIKLNKDSSIFNEGKRELVNKVEEKISLETCVCFIDEIEKVRKNLRRKINLNNYQHYFVVLLKLLNFF